MKTLVLFLSVIALSISSAHAANCKVVYHGVDPDLTSTLTEVLSEHGYTVSNDEDSQYSVTSTTDNDENPFEIKTEIQLMNHEARIAKGTGSSLFPGLTVILDLCNDDEDCIGRRYKHSLNRALRDFKAHLEVCHAD